MFLNFKRLFVFLFLFISTHQSLGQASDQAFLIKGTVLDSDSQEGVPFSSISIINQASDSIVGGTSANIDGYFELRINSENIRIEISSIGYDPLILESFSFTKQELNLGSISMSKSSFALDEAVIQAEKSNVEFKLDKRFFNVGADISSTGMGALEVLNNVPSVNVDIEGQVTLRGNAGVQILIDGKPSVLTDEASNALGSLTADMIERIEVITNPSAKYEAEGSSGIINIVLKKEEKRGFNGSISLNTGIPDNHSIGASLNYRTEKFNFFNQIGAGYRSLPTKSENRNDNLIDTTEIYSEGIEFRNEYFYTFRLGADYYLNKYNTITLSGNYAYEVEDQPSETDFFLYNSSGELVSQYQRTEVTSATNPKWQYDLQYAKEFKNNKEHQLLFSTLGAFFGKDLNSLFTNEYLIGPDSTINQKTATNFYRSDYTFKLDYTNPITKAFTLETGALYEINDVGNDYQVSDLVGSDFVIDSSLTNNFEFDQKVFGAYGTAAYEKGVWGLKLGLRFENTDLATYLVNTDESNIQNYTNFFPSFHSSYKASETISIQAGYSRRIFRPRLWDLNPFFNIRNNFNIRTGNPNLMPEYADSYELTAIFLFEKASINTSIYNLYTTDVVERVSTLIDNVNYTLPINVGTNNKTGFELNGKYTPIDWFSLNGDFNYGVFVRKGSYKDQSFDFIGQQWSLKFTTKFKLPKEVDLELTPNYQSAFKTVQGNVSGFAFVDIGLRKKLWKGKAVINLAVRDVFASRIRENFVIQEGFTSYNFSQRGRFITLGFSYSFGKGEAMTYSGSRR